MSFSKLNLPVSFVLRMSASNIDERSKGRTSRNRKAILERMSSVKRQASLVKPVSEIQTEINQR